MAKITREIRYDGCSACTHCPEHMERRSGRCAMCDGRNNFMPKQLPTDQVFVTTNNPYLEYTKYDVEWTKRMLNSVYGRSAHTKPALPKIKNVIFNDPATIVFWADGTKTVVQARDIDEFDPEKGLTMAITKKLYGNKGSYYNEIKKWTEPYYEKIKEEGINNFRAALKTFSENFIKGITMSNFEVPFDFVPVTEHFGYIPHLYVHGTEYKIFRVDYLNETFDSMDISYKREFYAIERCKKLENGFWGGGEER